MPAVKGRPRRGLSRPESSAIAVVPVLRSINPSQANISATISPWARIWATAPWRLIGVAAAMASTSSPMWPREL